MTQLNPVVAGTRSRLVLLDFLRLTAMLLMVQGHTLDSLVSPAYLDIRTFPWNIWHALRGMTAPMFLLLSGAAGVLALRRDWAGRVSNTWVLYRVAWGFGLMALGYLLVFPANRIADLRWLSPEVWRGFLQVNILQLNGLGLLLSTGLVLLTRTDRAFAQVSLALGAGLILGTPFVQAVDWFHILPEGLAAYLSQAHGSLFPLFPYGAYLFLGVGLGMTLRGGAFEVSGQRFERACWWGTLGALILAALLSRMQALFPPHDPYAAGPSFALLRLAMTLPFFALLVRLANRWPRFAAACAPWGRRSLQVYVGHLVLLYGLPWFSGVANHRFQSLTLHQGLACVLLVGGVTFGGVALLDLLKRRAAPLNSALRLTAASLLVWALVF